MLYRKDAHSLVGAKLWRLRAGQTWQTAKVDQLGDFARDKPYTVSSCRNPW